MTMLGSMDRHVKKLKIDKILPGIYSRIYRTGANYERYLKNCGKDFSFYFFIYAAYLDARHGDRFAEDVTIRGRVLAAVRKRISLFDASVYRSSHRDLVDILLDDDSNWSHFIGYGWAENRKIANSLSLTGYDDVKKRFSDFLARLVCSDTAPARAEVDGNYLYSPTTLRRGNLPHVVRVIDLIMPVYGNFELTKISVESVLAARNSTRNRLFILNDCSPDPNITSYLRFIEANNDNVTLLENSENLGFVRTVNRGFMITEYDTVILNSDIEVSDFWLDRLIWHSESQSSVGTITPFSNNATICSFPYIGKDNERWQDLSVGRINELFYEANKGLSIEIPTGVGFCMYVSRALLESVGAFDEASFGHGYGEENDLCHRAAQAGFKNLHALDVYVYHAGRASFDLKNLKPDDNMPVLVAKHPAFLEEVAQAFESDLSGSARLRVIILSALSSPEEKSLIILHNLGGGTASIADHDRSKTGGIVFNIVPNENQDNFAISVKFGEQEFGNGSATNDEIKHLICAGMLDRIVVHHLFGLDQSVLLALRQTTTPVEVFVHDLIWVCPYIFGLRPGGQYCGFPSNTNVCTKCQLFDGEAIDNGGDNALWRERHASILRAARVVVVASQTVADILRRILPGPNYIVSDELWRKWEATLDWKARTRAPVLDKARPLVVLGSISERKGRSLVEAVMPHLKRLGIRLTVVGEMTGNEKFVVDQSGRYSPDRLTELLQEKNPAAIWISSTAIETFSLTLSEALASGYPVIVNDIAILDERAKDHDHTYLLDHNEDPQNVAADICEILSGRKSQLKDDWVHTRAPEPAESIDSAAIFPNRPPRVHINLGAKPKVSFLVSNHDTKKSLGYRVPDACAYVRLLSLVDHVGDAFELSYFADPNMLTMSDIRKSDVFVTNRNALEKEYFVDRVVSCQLNHGTKVVYDIDDQLYEIDKDHPEADYYRKQAMFMREITKKADQVICSTQTLKDFVIEHFNENCSVVRNSIRRDWFQKYSACGDRQKALRLVYYGTSSHRDDWLMIADDVVRFCENHSAEVEFQLIGVMSDQDRPAHWPANMSILSPPHFATLSYKGFCGWLSNAVAPDVAFAPLEKSYFNQFKSELKVLEIAASGATPVFSKGFSYDDVVRSETGFGVGVDRDGSWADALQGLLEASAERKRELKRANHSVLDAWSSVHHAAKFHEILWRTIGAS